MGTTIIIASILLALIAAGCIAYIAWELTSGDPASDNDDETPSRD